MTNHTALARENPISAIALLELANKQLFSAHIRLENDGREDAELLQKHTEAIHQRTANVKAILEYLPA